MLKEIQEKIEQLASESKHDAIVTFLEKVLVQKKVSAQEIYDYSKDYAWSTKRGQGDYVITADTINQLGVMLSERKIASEVSQDFFKLAAHRGSNWGCYNYASEMYNKNSKVSLIYIKKALELSSAEDQKYFQLLFSRILWKNKLFNEANVALVEHLNHKTSLYHNDPKRVKEYQKELEEAIATCKFRFDFYEQTLQTITDPVVIEPHIAQIALFLTGYISYLPLYAPALSQAAYLQGQLYERLEQPALAMQAYAKVTDRQYAHYAEASIARLTIIKAHIAQNLTAPIPSLAVDALAVAAEALTINAAETAIASPVSQEAQAFSHLWQSGNERIDFFDSVTRNRLFREQTDPLWERINEKQEMLADLEKQLKLLKKRGATDSALTEQAETLDAEISELVITVRAQEARNDCRAPEKREVLRRYLAEKHFFNPHRNLKQNTLLVLTTDLVSQRFNHRKNNAVSPLDLTGLSTRQLISAEAVFQKATVDLMAPAKYTKRMDTLGFPIMRKSTFNSNDVYYGPVESYRVGETLIEAEHRADPKVQRLGSSYVNRVKTYDGIFAFLNKISGAKLENEQILASYFIRYGKTHQPVILEELQAINSKLNSSDVDEFNRIAFLIMEKEQAQWHVATQECHHLGMAVSQARCMILLREGLIRFVDVFKNAAKYGVYSQYNLVDYPGEVAAACKKIDELYKTYLCRDMNVASVFFKKANQTTVEVTNPYIVLSRKQARADLNAVYNEECESDGEGYDTDISIGSRL